MAETELQRIEDDARQILANLATDVTTLAADVAAVKGNVLTAIQAANAPLWLPDLLARLDALKAAVDDLKTLATANQAADVAELDKIEQDLAPPPPVSLQFWSIKDMAFVTSISPLAGVISELSVTDESGVNLPPSTISWSAPVGESAASDMTDLATADADGVGFDFMPSATAPTEAFTVVATWKDPAGMAPPVFATLTINLAAVVVTPPAPTSLQFDLMKGT